MFARRELLKFVLGLGVVSVLPWRRFEWRELTLTEIMNKTLREHRSELERSVLSHNRLLAGLAGKSSGGYGARVGTVRRLVG